VAAVKVTVCQLHSEAAPFVRDWENLAEHVHAHDSQLVVLPELAFYPPFTHRESFDPSVWQAAVAAHTKWQARFDELAPAAIAGSRPIDFGNERYNEGFLWDPAHGLLSVHAKSCTDPQRRDTESVWYRSATPEFVPMEFNGVGMGFLIGAELMLVQQAQTYAAEGVKILIVPRQSSARDDWLPAGQEAAIRGHIYVASSNRVDAGAALDDRAWIIAPNGAVDGTTDSEYPMATVDIDLSMKPQVSP
jgi:predicted amidohydrolase